MDRMNNPSIASIVSNWIIVMVLTGIKSMKQLTMNSVKHNKINNTY